MNRPDNWLDRYIGLPWKIGGRELYGGIDCWGLVRLVMRDEAGIDVPSWVDDPDAHGETCRSRSRAFDRHLDQFFRVPAGEEQLFDIVTFFIGPALWHVGILVELPHTMLHIEGQEGSQCEDWTLRPDLRKQFGGFWRVR